MSEILNACAVVSTFAGIVSAVYAVMTFRETCRQARVLNENTTNLRDETSRVVGAAPSGINPVNVEEQIAVGAERNILAYLVQYFRSVDRLSNFLFATILLASLAYFLIATPYDGETLGGYVPPILKAAAVAICLTLLFSMVTLGVMNYNIGYIYLGNLSKEELLRFITYFKGCRWVYDYPRMSVQAYLRLIFNTKEFFPRTS